PRPAADRRPRRTRRSPPGSPRRSGGPSGWPAPCWPSQCLDLGGVTAAMADPLAATRRLGPPLLDVPRGTPPLLVPRVRRLASVSAISLCSLHPGRGTYLASR